MARILLHSLFKQIMARRTPHAPPQLVALTTRMLATPASRLCLLRGPFLARTLRHWKPREESCWDSGDDSPAIVDTSLANRVAFWVAVWLAVLPMTSGADCGNNGRWGLFMESKPKY